MKFRPVLACLFAIQALAPLIRAADDPAPASTAPAAAPADPDDDKKTELELRMDKIGKAYRRLKKQVADPSQNASSLNLLSVMQDAIREAADLTPAKADDLPDDQKAKFIEDYKAGIKGMQEEYDKLADALTAGKNDEAAKIIAEIDALEKKDHKEFKKPKKD
jgi:soluble cytochrome b562